MKRIPLSQGKFAIVDDEDYEWLSQWKWCISDTGYALRKSDLVTGPTQIRMHRQIMRAQPGEQVDHINGATIDNRRSNLRLCTDQQNKCNLRVRSGPKTSKYKGVYFMKKDKLWIAKIKYNRVNYHIGSFSDEASAAHAYNERASQLFGEYAWLNPL